LRSKLKRRIITIISIVIAFLLIISLILPTLLSGASTLDELYGQYDQLVRQQEQIEKKIKDNNDKKASTAQKQKTIAESISSSQKEIKLLNSIIDTLNAQIAEKQAAIEKAQKDIDENYELFKQRMRAMYEAGNLTYIQVLLSSSSLTDFLAREEIIRQIAKHDTELLKRLEQDKQVIVDAQNAIKQQEEANESYKASLVAKTARLERQQAQNTQLIVQLNSENAALEAKQEALNSQIQEALRSLESSGGGLLGTGNFRWPTASYNKADINTGGSKFGWRTNPYTGRYSYHDGIDISGSLGVPIYAADSGTVRFSIGSLGASSMAPIYGRSYVFIDHHNGYITMYGHNSRRASGVYEGAAVVKGQIIAYMGSEGWSTGPHLHFSIYKNGTPVNPLNYLP
jgi:murein DD-endopeptidase MepM/ murein hydrolase activator NlpD